MPNSSSWANRRVVNSLDFCLASLKSHGRFYFQWVLFSQWKAATMNLQILHFWEAHSQKAITCCLCYRMPQNSIWSAKKRCKDTFFSTFHSLSPVIFATATVVALVLLRNSRFNFHCYMQHEATPTQKSARKLMLWPLAQKITKGIHLCKPASLNRPVLEVKCILVLKKQ